MTITRTSLLTSRRSLLLLSGSLALAGTHVDAFVVFCVLAGAVTIAAASVRLVRGPAAA